MSGSRDPRNQPPSDQPGRKAGQAPISAEEVLESISDAFYAVDHEWRFTYVNSVAERWWKRSRQELVGKHYWTEFPQAVGSEPYHAHLEAARDRRVIRLEAISPIVGHWIDVSIYPSPGGLCVYFRDISERKREEARQTLLVNELNHRVKNTLATVQSIAAQSFKGRDVPSDARKAFVDRLIALARANDLVVQNDWQGAGLREVVEQVVSPHASLEGVSPFRITGPDLLLQPRAATSLALGFHELATNAAKYGALSVPSASVAVQWDILTETGGQVVRIVWAESGGPRVEKPLRAGFGTRLLNHALRAELGAVVDLKYAATGFVCTIKAPLSALAM